jgi:ATP-dependent 26S proteasome regulatory subunit
MAHKPKRVTVVEPFANSLQHILAELARIDLLIRAQVSYARQLQTSDPAFRGLYIAEDEVERLLAQPIDLPAWASRPAASADTALPTALQTLAEAIAARTASTLAQERPLPLDRLVQHFGLTPFERDALLICLTAELDLRYERLFAYLHDDVNKKRPTVDLILNLLSTTLVEKISRRRHFLPTAPLRRHQLVEVIQGADDLLLTMRLRVEPRMVHYLLQDASADGATASATLLPPAIAPYLQLLAPTHTLADLALPAELHQSLAALCDPGAIADHGLIVALYGPYGVGKRLVADALCTQLAAPLLWVDTPGLATQHGEQFTTSLDLILREAWLQEAALFWADFDALLTADAAPQLRSWVRALEGQQALSILAGQERWTPTAAFRQTPFLPVELPTPGYIARLASWQRALDVAPISRAPALDPAALANKFRFTHGEIEDAMTTAVNLARLRQPQQPQLMDADLHIASRLHSNQKLGALAQKITPHYGWDDIVLPADQLRQLHEICDQVNYRARVYEQWGFGAKLALGKGVSALFSGPPGTGKTMAAEILAGALGLDLYKIDLSTVVSKYIGETEKNLARIFAEAETSNAILFFDEADALFGKRSEVRDSHDRYANIETGYLLQRIEAYTGVVILATNFARNLDDAFIRRLQFIVEFPFPAEEERRAIWERIWPQATPRDPALDLTFAARELKLAGGHIRNIALAATFLAAANGQVVTMAHLIHATRREFQKMGRVVVAEEFGDYAVYAR